ncbi:MAG TPA: protein translocase subunit SecD, partial [Actinomycetaceae bacterium]|nr:protein translocase subunit SecD [Actinomycetaceae bacterium]
ITSQDVDQAIEIIRQRVDASGVAEAEIARQGQANIVVGLPGNPTQETLDLVRQSAQLRFRPVLEVFQPQPLGTTEEVLAEFGVSDVEELPDEPGTTPQSGSDPAWITERLLFEAYQLDCTDEANLVGGIEDASAEPLVACADDGTAKYLLGPTDLEGTHISGASSGLEQATSRWAVTMELDSEGRSQFRDISARLVELPQPRNQFGIVLDGLVISAPVMQGIIPDGRPQITGSFTSEEAAALANQLNFGSLPLNFEVQSQEQISATLGAEHLRTGLLAGVAGLVLVALYLLWQYRALALVAIASLVIAAGATYATIITLSWLQGYRLSLAGVAGLIVAVGITADSFILYFERIRDELRDGRALDAAIVFGWTRAKRTIIITDVVTLLAASVLYFLAVGGVRGFAFTLGLTTLIDLVVVFLFTHPAIQLIARTRLLRSGHRLSGLYPPDLGVTLASFQGGTGATERQVPRERERRRSGRREPAGAAEEQGLTIAQRRAAERQAAANESAASPGSADTSREREEA